MNEKLAKKSLGILLSVTVGMTGISFPALKKNASAETVKPEIHVDSLLQVKVDGGSEKNMQLYRNGVYEAAEKMAAGTHKVSLLVDGVEADAADITLSAAMNLRLP